MSQRPIDRTYIAVQRQLKAMGEERFEIGIYDRQRDSMRNQELGKSEVLEKLPWLKRENAQGKDIYIRPLGSQGLVFFDDLNQKKLSSLVQAGFQPALAIESSPYNFHGWIRVSLNPIETDLASAICQYLAARYGGDKDSADWRHYGRLAGFTNRKPAYVDRAGNYPYVLLKSSVGKLADQANRLIEEGKAILDYRNQQKRRTVVVRPGREQQAVGFYQNQLGQLRALYGEDMDCSRADWMIVCRMVELGYSREDVAQALWIYSPALETRLGKHAQTYVDLTITKAFNGGVDMPMREEQGQYYG